jgi:hypothetical protein
MLNYNLKHQSNINRILDNKDAILLEYNSLKNPKKKSLKKTKLEHVDEGLKKFIRQCNNEGVVVNGVLLQEKALDIAKASSTVINFKASSGYLNNFKRRNLVFYKTIHGQDDSVEPEIIEMWYIKLDDLLHLLDPKNIYNGDELGLFWRLQASKTHVMSDTVCKMGKQSKERITIFLCSNMVGDKFDPLVIGKSANPRGFNIMSNLDMSYYSNKTAWMTSDIFYDFLVKLNQKMVADSRFIILFVDNCPSHPVYQFSNVRLFFLPPNTTSKLQPMDAGIIKCFKGLYRLNLAKKIITNIECGLPAAATEVKFIHAMQMLTNAWKSLKPNIIVNCFKKCGFYRTFDKSTESVECIEDETQFNDLQREFDSINKNRISSVANP